MKQSKHVGNKAFNNQIEHYRRMQDKKDSQPWSGRAGRRYWARLRKQIQKENLKHSRFTFNLD